MWDKVDGMAAHHGRAGWRFTIDGEPVSEGAYKRKYIAALERELEVAHDKLAKIYDVL